MIYSNPDQIGILACPGGAAFAKKVVSNLEKISQKNYWRKIQSLSEKYGLSKEEITRRINLFIDMRPSTMDLNQPSEGYRSVSFSVPTSFVRFPNGEFKTEIQATVRNLDLYIIQDVENHHPVRFNSGDQQELSLSVNDHIFCLLVTVDAALHAGAKRVTVVIPTYPYSRQHEKKRREGLTAARFGQIMEHMGVERIITLDIHSKEIENSFNHLRLENLYGSYQIMKVLATVINLKDPDLVIVSPDTGSVDRNKFFASALGKPLGIIYKERDYSRVSTNAHQSNITYEKLLGEVKGKSVFIADDMLGTGGTFLTALRTLREHEAKKVICAVSLPYFTANAIQEFEEAYREGLFHRFIGTNAIHHGKELLGKEWYLSADVSELFARSIHRLHYNRSVSSLMDNRRVIQNLIDHSE